MGNDYRTDSMSVKAAATDAVLLRQVFERINADSCPKHYNFHMHTVCSDGRLTPQQIVEQAIEIGLDGLAITDHHTIDGYLEAQICLERSTCAKIPHLWTGIEITAYLPPLDVHILGYGFDPTCPSLAPYLQGYEPKGGEARADRVIDALHAAGAIVVLAHPARYRRTPEEVIGMVADLGIDGVETYYAYGNPTPWVSSFEQTETVKRLGNRYNLLHTCGTDTHGTSLLQRL
jgi:predicted metal-dependent phosphoesterase TrpH